MAPQVQLRFIGEGSGDDRDIAHGLVDLDVGDVPHASAGLCTRVIAAYCMMLVARKGSTLDRPHPTADAIAAVPHIAISRRGRDRGPLDDRLAEAGLARQVIATVPTVAAALEIVATTPSVTLLPERLARSLPEPLVARPLPFALDAAPIALSWHGRHDADPAHAWIRDLVATTLEAKPHD